MNSAFDDICSGIKHLLVYAFGINSFLVIRSGIKPLLVWVFGINSPFDMCIQVLSLFGLSVWDKTPLLIHLLRHCASFCSSVRDKRPFWYSGWCLSFKNYNLMPRAFLQEDESLLSLMGSAFTRAPFFFYQRSRSSMVRRFAYPNLVYENWSSSEF